MKFFILLVLVLFSCAHQEKYKETKLLASTAGFEERKISAAPFILTSFQRVKEKGEFARVYIEGDGNAWLSRSRPSFDPTPKNPLALKFAIKDSHSNVIYLGRPCQYNQTKNCHYSYWTSKRFSEEVIASTNNALDKLKEEYGFKSFELVGFSGGAAVAILTAVRRKDVKSIRTVAGNLDHVKLNDLHEVSPMPDSLNPADVASKLVHTPQLHLVGGKDKIVPWQIFESYSRKAKILNCLNMKVLPNATHHEGWVDQWANLLQLPFTCIQDCN